MTTQNWQDPTGSALEDPTTGSSRVDAGGSSATSTAKEAAADVAGETAGAAKDVASTAVSEARHVAQDAGTQVRNLVGELGTGLKEQAESQQQKVAQGLRSISEELRIMVQKSESPGTASNLVEQAAQRTGDVAGWFEARDPGSLLDEMKGFARRRPAAFLLAAAGAGLLAGRMTRGLSGGGSGTQAESTAPFPRTVPAAPAVPPVAGTPDAYPAADPLDTLPDPWVAGPAGGPGTPPATDPGSSRSL